MYYGVRGIPTVVIIAPDGTVRHNSTGFSEADEIKRTDGLLAEFRLRLPPPGGRQTESTTIRKRWRFG